MLHHRQSRSLSFLAHNSMDLKDVQQNWNRFGAVDPFWAVLAWPGMKGNQWDSEAFFATGRDEITSVMDYVNSLPVSLSHGTALDFGCGVGRLTEALADHFDSVHGVDISDSMIELARQLSQHGDRCQYHLNVRDDLSLFEEDTFDFIYSNITLQHMPPRFSRRYILEFMRILKSGGVAMFQIPDHPRHPLQRLLQPIKPTAFWRRYQKLRYGERPAMNMYGIPKKDVQRLISTHGEQLLAIQPDGNADTDWVSYRYTILKTTRES
ncbi:MAG: SAM-dependent methyltransferase [Clostridia bacterium]|nr:MAG: SAM-dependent methyltransferase [Clostridia bacterium]